MRLETMRVVVWFVVMQAESIHARDARILVRLDPDEAEADGALAARRCDRSGRAAGWRHHSAAIRIPSACNA